MGSPEVGPWGFIASCLWFTSGLSFIQDTSQLVPTPSSLLQQACQRLAMALAFSLLAPAVAINARAWRPSEPSFVYPELAEDSLAQHLSGKNFGIALAGGGARGMALGHGVLRSLREAGVLEQAKYVSVTSGSVWLGVPFYYQSIDSLEDYLGSSIPASELHPETLLRKTGTGISRLSFLREFPKTPKVGKEEVLKTSREEPRIFDCPLDEGWCACAVSRLQPGNAFSTWPLFMAYIFLHPFDLAGHDSIHCHVAFQQL